MMCVLVISFTNCKKEKKAHGFDLQRFDVVSLQLDSVIDGLKDSCNFIPSFEDGEILVMLLRIYDSIPEFCFTIANKKDFAEDYIFNSGRRIVGFIEHKNIDFIVLSTELSKTRFEMDFYNYIHPTKDTKYFDYIYFPGNMYAIMEDGIPYPPALFNPIYRSFVDNGSEIVLKKRE